MMDTAMQNQRIIDLTLPLRDSTSGFSRQIARTLATDGFNTSNLHIYSHAGTHMDAPLHFLDGGASIDQWDLRQCAGPALVADLTHKAPQSLIAVDDLQPWAQQIGAGTRLLIATGWDSHADQADYRTHFPRISLELAQWLGSRRVALLGIETPSVASLHPQHTQELTDVHRALLSAGIVIVESLANLRQIQQPTVFFIALPLRIEGCDGSPVRAVAIENFAHS
jgi:kynurenine formamidase